MASPDTGLPRFAGLRLQHWHAEDRADGVVVLSLDRAGESVNALSQDVLVELDGLIERIAIDPPPGVDAGWRIHPGVAGGVYEDTFPAIGMVAECHWFRFSA